jgi:hypothetical protein
MQIAGGQVVRHEDNNDTPRNTRSLVQATFKRTFADNSVGDVAAALVEASTLREAMDSLEAIETGRTVGGVEVTGLEFLALGKVDQLPPLVY